MKTARELDRAIDDDLMTEWDTAHFFLGGAERRLPGVAGTGEMDPPRVRYRGTGVDGWDH